MIPAKRSQPGESSHCGAPVAEGGVESLQATRLGIWGEFSDVLQQ